MAGIKRYKFNAETLAYEVHKIPFVKRFSKGFALFLLSVVSFVGYFLIYTLHFGFDTPKLMALKQKSVELQSKLELLERRFEQNNNVLMELQRRDNYVYRPIFGMEEIPQDVRNAGFGGVNRYAHLENLSNSGFLTDIEKKQLFYDSKTILQEMVQAEFKDSLVYELLKEEGPDHNKTFEVSVKVGGRVIGRGVGRTKKAAEQVAAYHGICELKK